jgi:hypothetical protein
LTYEEKIKLELNNNWEFFTGTNFQRIYDQKYFEMGNILRKNGKKYFELNSGGLTPLLKYNAYRKMILYVLKNSCVQIRRDNLSKRKTLIWLELGYKNEIELVVRKSDPILKEINNNNSKTKQKIHEKSMELLLNLVKRDRRISFKDSNTLEILSRNGKKYLLNLDSGSVKSSTGRSSCVQISPWGIRRQLDSADIAITKALMIAHSPESIYTL